MMDTLVSHLRHRLTQQRPLSDQVLHHIRGHYTSGEGTIEEFFAEHVPRLEEYELDIIFSPMFTPDLTDRVQIAPFLDDAPLRRDEVDRLITELAEAQLHVPLELAQGEVVSFPLPEVLIERFVRLLELTVPLPPPVRTAIERTVPEDVQYTVKAIVRRSQWQPQERQRLLIGLLETMRGRRSFRVEKLTYLTDFVGTHRPADAVQLAARLAEVIASMEEELETIRSGKHIFFEEVIEHMHGGSRDERGVDLEKLARVEYEYALACSLRDDLDVWLAARGSLSR